MTEIELITANGRTIRPFIDPSPCSCDYETFGAHSSACESHKVPYIPVKSDMVDHPPHYNQGGLEAADIIEAFKLPYHLGTVAKYVLRCQYKGEMLEDLRKAAWHLNRQIELEEKNA